MIILCLLCATSSVLATIGMKYWDVLPRLPIAVFIIVTVVFAVWAEIEALRRAEMAMTFIAILGLEATIAIVASYWLLGETFSTTKLLGASMVLIGVALINATQQSN